MFHWLRQTLAFVNEGVVKDMVGLDMFDILHGPICIQPPPIITRDGADC